VTRRRVAAALLIGTVVFVGFLFAVVIRETSVGGEPNAAVPLRALGETAGVEIGSAIQAPALKDYPGYREEAAREFSSLTPENALKWDAIEPRRGRFFWRDADAAVSFARQHGMTVRGHTLLWHNQLPAWLGKGEWTRAELRLVLRNHIRRVMERYRGRVAEWDVLNEIVADSGAGLRRSLWSRVLGDDFAGDVLRWAHDADPDAKLYMNEIGADGLTRKSDGFYRLVARLKAQGAPLDGVGFQAHFNLDGVPDGFEDNLRRFAALGLDVRITELDVALKLPADEKALAAQAAVYAKAARACLRVDRCRGITVWGFTDRFSWIPMSQKGFGAATLLDRDLEPKPAYRAFADELAAGR